MVYPPPFGSRGSDGAVMLNGVKSLAFTSVLSVAVKFCSHRLKYPTSIDTRGASCCWTDAPICQSFGRMPQPLISAGSMFAVVCVAVPNVVAVDAWHAPLAALFVKLQFGI